MMSCGLGSSRCCRGLECSGEVLPRGHRWPGFRECHGVECGGVWAEVGFEGVCGVTGGVDCVVDLYAIRYRHEMAETHSD